jgi:hypothetical protein
MQQKLQDEQIGALAARERSFAHAHVIGEALGGLGKLLGAADRVVADAKRVFLFCCRSPPVFGAGIIAS